MFINQIFIDLISRNNLIVGYDNTKPIFKPEDDEGHIEYKLRLDQITYKDKINRMITQMKYRLNEGKLATGKFIAYYFLGIDDNGKVGYINQETIDKTIDVIKIVAEKSNAEVHIQEKVNTGEDRYIAAVCVRKCYDDRYIKEYRILMLGDSSSGKTTCISYLTYNERDNGNGSGRMVVFKHSHEQSTGITSSIKHDIIGFKNGSVNNYKFNTFVTWNNIVENSDKIISIFDLPGSQKYAKTIKFGITALKADIHMIIISADDFVISDETKWLIEMSINLNVRMFILVTKIDLVDGEKFNQFICRLREIFLTKYNRFFELYVSDLETYSVDVVPYLTVSNTTGEGYVKLVHFLDKISQIKIDCGDFKSQSMNSVDFMIYDVINIREVGYIVSGISISGSIKVGDRLLIGPIDGSFYPITIKSIRKKQLESNIIYPSESGSIEICMNFDFEVDKHMNILDDDLSKQLTESVFVETDMVKSLNFGHQYMLYVDNLIEPVIFVESSNGNAMFKFVKKSKFYVRKKSKCIIKSDPNYDFSIYGLIV